jgi:membrane fusion protein (multidrug efflux system)
MKTLFLKTSISRYLYRLAGYLVVATIVAACTIQAENLPETKPAAVPGIPVDAAVIRPGELSDNLEVTGSILANQQVDIVSELTRKVVNVLVKEGSTVRKGTLLFKLDDADLLAQLERLRQQEKLAVLNEKRLKDLIEHEAIAQQEYDEVSTNLRVLQAQILELQTIIDKTRIVAPFDGQIGMINTHVGAVVSVNTTLTNIQDNHTVKIEFSIPEKYTNVIKLGSKHSFTTPSNQSPLTTTLVAKAASLDLDTRSLHVRGVTDNSKGTLLPGQSARIRLALTTTANTISVPSQALIASPGGYTVFVARNNKAELVSIEIGERATGAVEILKGINPGDTVITSNWLRLAPGTPVNLVSIN